MPEDRLTFLGHSTVLIEMDGTRLLTDPVLGHVLWSIRRRAPAVAAHHLADVDAVFISHGHFDHLDLKSLRALPGTPTVIVPGGLGHIAGRAGLGPVQEVDEGDRVRVGTLEIEVMRAAHGRRRSPRVEADAALCCLVVGSSTVYFAGDTDVLPAWEGFAGRVDVALLPVGGWGPRLGRGHLDPESAAQAAATIRPAVAVPDPLGHALADRPARDDGAPVPPARPGLRRGMSRAWRRTWRSTCWPPAHRCRCRRTYERPSPGRLRAPGAPNVGVAADPLRHPAPGRPRPGRLPGARGHGVGAARLVGRRARGSSWAGRCWPPPTQRPVARPLAVRAPADPVIQVAGLVSPIRGHPDRRPRRAGHPRRRAGDGRSWAPSS